MLARFVTYRVIIEEAADTYFVDVAAYDSWRRSMRRRASMLLLGVGAIGALLAALA